jgi:hypothetical protein
VKAFDIGCHHVDANRAVNVYIDETREERQAGKINCFVCGNVFPGFEYAHDASGLDEDCPSFGYPIRQNNATIAK